MAGRDFYRTRRSKALSEQTHVAARMDVRGELLSTVIQHSQWQEAMERIGCHKKYHHTETCVWSLRAPGTDTLVHVHSAGLVQSTLLFLIAANAKALAWSWMAGAYRMGSEHSAHSNTALIHTQAHSGRGWLVPTQERTTEESDSLKTAAHGCLKVLYCKAQLLTTVLPNRE